MPKQITFTDIATIECTILKHEGGECQLVLVYTLKDDTGQRWNPKRYTMEWDVLTQQQKAFVNKVLKLMETKVKEIEEI